MGRRKSYDRETLVARAVEIFHAHGYAGTTTQMLTEGLGVNKFSLYAEFGSKQALFETALRRYSDEVIERRFGPLQAPGAGVAEVRALLEFYGAAAQSPASGRGCFLCNTAVEFGPDESSCSGHVQRYFARLSAAFHAALDNAQRKGEIDSAIDLQREAWFLTASVLGLFVMLRAKAPAIAVESAAQSAIDYLSALGGRRS